MSARFASRCVSSSKFLVAILILPAVPSAADWVNEPSGVITANGAPLGVTGVGNNFGFMHATNGGTLNIGDNWTNQPGGIIIADTSSILNFNGTWLNSGTVNLDPTSTLNLNGTVNLANLGTVNDSATSTINIGGTLDNTAPIVAPVYNGNWYLNSGTITGGSLNSSGSALSLSNGQTFSIQSGTLDGVSITGDDLNLNSPNTQLTIADGISVSTGNININNVGTSITLAGTQTLDNLNLNFNIPAAIPVTSLNIGTSGTSATITFGANLLVQGGNFQINHSSGSGAFVNNGTIRANVNGQAITLSGSLMNAGTLQAVNGGRLVFTQAWTNNSLLEADVGSSVSTANIFLSGVTNGLSGIINANGGTMNISSITNNGLVEATKGGVINISNPNSGGAATLNNNGTIESSTGGTINIMSAVPSIVPDGWSSGNLIDAYTGSSINFRNGVLTDPGTIRTDGGTITISALHFDSFIPTGIIQLHGGAITDNLALVLYGGTLTGWGTINATVALEDSVAPTVIIADNADPSANPSVTATLLFNIGGITPDIGYDSLLINGTMSLAGNLELQFANSFENSITSSDVFTVLTANSISGAFDNVLDGGRLETLDDFGSFQVNYGTGPNANEIILSNFLPGVPEPASLGLAIMALTLTTRFRRRT